MQLWPSCLAALFRLVQGRILQAVNNEFEGHYFVVKELQGFSFQTCSWLWRAGILCVAVLAASLDCNAVLVIRTSSLSLIQRPVHILRDVTWDGFSVVH